MVSLHGNLSMARRTGGIHSFSERPRDPSTLLDSSKALSEKVQMLLDWWKDKQSVLCITGAGLSTESGIPDYRGYNGSYHKGHEPMIHQQFMESEYQRKRYWGRSMVGWRAFYDTQPNLGHFALADLERMGRLGVTMEDKEIFYEPDEAVDFSFTSGQQKLSIVTQNVDSLHQQAGSKHIMQLHGGGNRVKCMQCGVKSERIQFHQKLQEENREWLDNALQGYEKTDGLRPDGDALVKEVDYNQVHVPPCPHCGSGFLKTDVVFFGDAVPKSRVSMCEEAVKHADGLLIVGSSLAVHSAFRHVRAASQRGIPIAILNVGETRAEIEGLANILKIEAPSGATLASTASYFAGGEAIGSKTSKV
jgi:NAD-dependent deacetylase sirtuin 4